MRLPSAIESLSAALHHAALMGLPDVPGAEPGAAPRRPDPSECSVVAMFAQTWGSTALGFGGLGGAAMTRAYTVVIQGPESDLAVYWNGRLAFRVLHDNPAGCARLLEDIAKQTTCGVGQATTRYGADVPQLACAGARSSVESMVARAMQHAALIGLPSEKRTVRDYASTDRAATKELVTRPNPGDCQLQAVFLQRWAHPDLGWEDPTPEDPLEPDAYSAYTLAIEGPDGALAVYWDGLPAFCVTKDNAAGQHLLRADLDQKACAHLSAAVARYGAQPMKVI